MRKLTLLILIIISINLHGNNPRDTKIKEGLLTFHTKTEKDDNRYVIVYDSNTKTITMYYRINIVEYQPMLIIDLMTDLNCDFKDSLDKFLEWEKTAIENEIILDHRELPLSPVELNFKLLSKNNKHMIRYKEKEIKLYFCSESTTDHYLKMSFEGLYYIDIKMMDNPFTLGSFHLSKNDIILLRNALDKEYIEQKITDKIEKEKILNELFN